MNKHPVSGFDSGKKAVAKKSNREKPTYREFMDDLQSAIACASKKDELPRVLRILKAGFEEKLSADHMDEIVPLLTGWPECSRLSIQLSTQTRRKHAPDLMRFLRNRLLSHARTNVGYPITDPQTNTRSRSETLREWIEHRAKSPRADNDCGFDAQDLERTRWTVVCLMEEPAVVRADGLYMILDQFGIRKKETEDASEDLGFLLEIGNLFVADKLNSQKLESGKRLASAARAVDRATRQELATALSTIDTLSSRLTELMDRIASLDESLSLARDRIAEVEGSLAAKTQEIEHEREERDKDQQHWEAVSEQRLMRLANEVSSRLAHEIKEAKLCLSDESPNLRMALDRLKQMEKWLSKLRSE